MTACSVQIVLAVNALSPDAVWGFLQSNHPALLSGETKCDFAGSACTLDRVVKRLRRGQKVDLDVTFNSAELGYGHVTRWSHSFVSVKRIVVDKADACLWVSPFLTVSGFRHAWFYDDQYNYWQNADDPLEYTARGRSYAGLPMKSNGLPPPVNQMIIDTSKNAGRRVIRQGFVEAIGAAMWLGDPFWALTGARKDEVLQQDWLKCTELPGGVLLVQAADAPFATAEGAVGELQRKLRRLFFPNCGG